MTVAPAASPTATAQPSPILEVQGLTKRFSGLVALSDYRLDLARHTIHGVIGPNGAGKTTLFNLLSGMLAPTSGSIRLAGVEIAHRPPHEVARRGIARTFQNIRLFGDMTAIDNVKVAVQQRSSANLVATLAGAPSFFRHERDITAEAFSVLERVGLRDRADRLARNLPYGDQRRLEIARAIATEPTVLLLDEPNAGMNPTETAALLELIRHVRDELGITIILVAHDIPLVMNLCERIQVLNYGQLIADGPPTAVRADVDVIAAYLGTAGDA